MKLVIMLLSSTLLLSCTKKSEPVTEKPVPVSPAVQTSPASTAEKLTHITSTSQFDTFFEKQDRLIVVDMYADWCGPCKMIAPFYSELSGEFGEKADFLKVNVDDNSSLAQRFGVNGIPDIILIKNGKVLDRAKGSRSKEEYKQLLLKYL